MCGVFARPWCICAQQCDKVQGYFNFFNLTKKVHHEVPKAIFRDDNAIHASLLTHTVSMIPKNL